MAKPNSIKKSLLPLSFLYGIGVMIRNKLFDWKILPSEEFIIPIVSIGNITVGGTGKTPHTEYLINLLSEKMRVGVLSRGYKRKTKRFILADENATSKTIGDEPYQIYKKFPGIQVAVDGNRRRGIKKLLEQPEQVRPEIILLDDAFQHRYVHPSLSILLTDSNRLIYEDALLPAGRLREPVESKSRAHIVIITKCSPDFKPIDYRIIAKHLNLFPYQALFFTSLKYGALTPVFKDRTNNKEWPLEHLRNNKTAVLLVTGIASPEVLQKELESYALQLETITFPDHHDFSVKDMEEITKRFDKIQVPNKIIITTEKDAARLINNQNVNERIKDFVFYLPVEVHFNLEQEKLFNQKIEEHVKNVKRNRSLS